MSELAAVYKPYSMSPIPGPKTADPSSLATKLFGARTVRDLGALTTCPGAVIDTPIVHRSWGLLGGADFYGPNFYFSEFMKARNVCTAVVFHLAFIMGTLLLAIPLTRTVARNYVYEPGDGPTKEEGKNDRVEYRGIGNPDTKAPNPPRAFCTARFEGSLYARKFLCCI